MTKQHHRGPAGDGNDSMRVDRTSSLEGSREEGEQKGRRKGEGGGEEKGRRINEEGVLPVH